MKVASVKRHPNKKADATECPQAFHYVGLLVNEPPGAAELLFIESSEDPESVAVNCLKYDRDH